MKQCLRLHSRYMEEQMNNRALIAMSGGVDSAVAAYLMLESGYDCMGATMKLFNKADAVFAADVPADGTEGIPEHLDWRTQKLKIDSYDYEYLREWRIKGETFDFSKFPKSDIIVIAPNRDALNHLVVRFDMEFTGIVNYYTGDVEEDWSEVWKREWKGISVDKLGTDNLLDDFAVSGSTISQVLEEDMFDKLLSDSPWNVLTNK